MMSLAIGFDLDKSGLIFTGGGITPPVEGDNLVTTEGDTLTTTEGDAQTTTPP